MTGHTKERYSVHQKGGKRRLHGELRGDWDMVVLRLNKASGAIDWDIQMGGTAKTEHAVSSSERAAGNFGCLGTRRRRRQAGALSGRGRWRLATAKLIDTGALTSDRWAKDDNGF